MSMENVLNISKARAERIKRVRNLANLNRLQMCDSGLINFNTLKSWETALHGGLSKKGAEKIIQRVAKEGVICTLPWLMDNEGSEPYVIPKSVASSDGSPSPHLSECELFAKELFLLRSLYPGCIDIPIQDDGLAPFYQIDDHVAGIKHFNEEIAKCIGHDCIMQLSEGQILIRQIKVGRIDNTYTLLCTNPQTQVDEPIIYDATLVFAAPIVRHYRSVACL